MPSRGSRVGRVVKLPKLLAYMAENMASFQLKKKEKKKRRGEGFFGLGSWVFLVQYVILAKKKIPAPR